MARLEHGPIQWKGSCDFLRGGQKLSWVGCQWRSCRFQGFTEKQATFSFWLVDISKNQNSAELYILGDFYLCVFRFKVPFLSFFFCFVETVDFLTCLCQLERRLARSTIFHGFWAGILRTPEFWDLEIQPGAKISTILTLLPNVDQFFYVRILWGQVPKTDWFFPEFVFAWLLKYSVSLCGCWDLYLSNAGLTL